TPLLETINELPLNELPSLEKIDETPSTEHPLSGISKFTIFGERCSGTNFLEKAILTNFDIDITWEYGLKHFFGFNDYKNSDDVLFIGIVRDPYKWINSLYKTPHYLNKELRKRNPKTFLVKEFWSDRGKRHGHTEILEDRNIYTNNRY
ncbi:MAG: hypothetical protein Satyrvirus33_1, partial [Satyrvirus sp.]